MLGRPSDTNLPDLPPASCGRLLFCFTPAYAVTASLIINLCGNFDSVRLRVQFGRESLQVFPYLVLFEVFGEQADMKRPGAQFGG
jgi:hypothetical protein